MIGSNRLQEAWSRLRPIRPGAIGLDLSTERLNLAQFTPQPDGLTLTAIASVPYPATREDLLADPATLKNLLSKTLEVHGFKGRRTVSCVHAAELRFFPVTFQVTPNQDEAEGLVAELRKRLGAELETSVVDYLPIRSEDAEPSQRDALVVVAPRERVMRHLRALEGAGLEVAALDVGPAAVARLVAHLNQEDDRTAWPNTLAINFGQQHCHLTVVWGRRLTLDRQIDFSLQTLLDRIKLALRVNQSTAMSLLLEKGVQAEPGATGADADMACTLAEILHNDFAALVAEVNKTLIYTASRSRGRSVDQIYIMGSLGRFPGADRLLQAQLSVPVAVLNPFRAFASTVPARQLERLKPIAGIALACGLALRGANTHA